MRDSRGACIKCVYAVYDGRKSLKGELVDYVRCTRCHRYREHEEVFYELQLPIVANDRGRSYETLVSVLCMHTTINCA